MECTEEHGEMTSQFIKISSAVSDFLKIHDDIAISCFRDAFKEQVHLIVVQTEELYVMCSEKTMDIIKNILINGPMELTHSPEVRSLITKDSASWLTFTKSLTMEYTCAIYTEADFSKTYVFVAPHDSEPVSAKIIEFLQFDQTKTLPENKISEESSSVIVYKPFVDYLENYEEMLSILENSRPSSPGTPFIKIDISKESLKILKSKLETVTSQSCFLNVSKAKFFKKFKEEILCDIYREYQIIANVFESDLSMNSLVLTPRTDLICVVCSQTDCCPVDNYIDLKCSFSFTQTDDMVANETVSGMKIRKYKTWNLPFNQKLEVEFSLKEMDEWAIDFGSVLVRCFQILDDANGFSSRITGIHLQAGNLKIINKFCCDLVETLQTMDQISPDNSSDKCIFVMVDTAEIQAKVTEIITELKKEEIKRMEDNIIRGAIPKSSSKPTKEIHKDKPVLWIQFSDFSCTPENLKAAVDTLMNKLTTIEENYISTSARIHRCKLESLLFFYEKEVTELVPDIMAQLEESEEIIVPVVFPGDSQNSIQQIFKKLLKNIPKRLIDVKSVQDKILLNNIISDCNRNFSNVKCTYREERSNIFLESLNSEDILKTERYIKEELGLLTDQEKLTDKKSSEGLGAALESDKVLDVVNRFTFKVLYNDILTVDAEAIVCPISCRQTQNSRISDLVFNQAGLRVKNEVMAHYNQYSNRMLPEGKVIFTSGGSLKYKLIIYVCCPMYNNSKGDDNIQKILVQAITDVLSIAERHGLQSVALPTIGAGIFEIPFDLCLESSLVGIEDFRNQNSVHHLKVINFVDYQEDFCRLIMNFLNIYQVPFQHNLKKKNEGSMENLIDMYQCQNNFPNSFKFTPDVTHDELGATGLQEMIPDFYTDITHNELRATGIRETIPDFYPELTHEEIREKRIRNLLPKSDFNPDITHDEIRPRRLEETIPNITHDEIRPRRLQKTIPNLNRDLTHEIRPRRLQETVPNFNRDLTLDEIRAIRVRKLEPTEPYSNPNITSDVLRTSELQETIKDDSPYLAYNEFRTTELQQMITALTNNKPRRRQKRIPFSNSVPCPVCFKPVTKPRKFDDCKHVYCNACIIEYIEVIGKMCPLCLNIRPQPPGEMQVRVSETHLPGFEDCESFTITYEIPNGIQQMIHPNPGKMYTGIKAEAYLPANNQGSCILKMLQKAFESNLIFTIGDSISKGKSDTVIWNGILHKTKKKGGPLYYGYPDPSYLSHVLAQLIEAGITPESVASEVIKDKIRMTAFS